MSWCVLARSHSRRQQPAMDSTIFQVGICENARCKRRWQIVILRKHIVRIEFCEIKRLCHLHCFTLVLRQFQSDFQWFSPCSGRAKLALDVQKLILPRHLETQSAVESFVSVALRTGRRNPSAETEQSSDENKEGTFLFQAVRFGFEPSREGAQRCLPSISLAFGRVAPAETGFN